MLEDQNRVLRRRISELTTEKVLLQEILRRER